jgi:Protein of unknown function (DUF3421)
VSVYEILVGDSRATKWVPTGGKLRIDQLHARPVEGGQENNGTPIYLAVVEHHGHQPGKISPALDGEYSTCIYRVYSTRFMQPHILHTEVRK